MLDGSKAYLPIKLESWGAKYNNPGGGRGACPIDSLLARAIPIQSYPHQSVDMVLLTLFGVVPKE